MGANYGNRTGGVLTLPLAEQGKAQDYSGESIRKGVLALRVDVFLNQAGILK